MSKKKKSPVKKKVKKIVKRPIKKKLIKKPTKKIIRKKKILKKTPLKKPAKKISLSKDKGNIVGVITHYFPHVNAGVIKVKANISVGDTIKIKGHTTDFTQKVSSIQIDRIPVSQAKKGDDVGVEVNSRVRRHDIVYKV